MEGTVDMTARGEGSKRHALFPVLPLAARYSAIRPSTETGKTSVGYLAPFHSLLFLSLILLACSTIPHYTMTHACLFPAPMYTLVRLMRRARPDSKQQKLELVKVDIISYFMRILHGLTHHR